MKRLLIYIPIAFQFVATLLLLSVVCISSTELSPGEQAKHWWWLSYTGIIYMICIGVSLLFYSWKENEKCLDYASVVAYSLILFGAWEAIVGLRQLYGFAYSNHSLFSLTGTFFNPGPYSGYLALVFPICLSEYFRLKRIAHLSILAKIGYYGVIGVLLLIICVLPAGMSRSAWLAAGISGLFVAWQQNGWREKLTVYRKNYRQKFILWVTLSSICLVIVMAAVFYLKKDSANGRLFMWKIGINAVSEHPFTGHGIDRFPVAYGEAQEAYFAKGNYAEWEEHVAGSPEYAFNEYLQVAIEWGVPALLLCLAIVGICFWCGLRNHRIGICGGILSLAIFSFSSYPLQLPVFIVTFLVLLFASIAGKSRLRLLFFSVVIGGCGIYLQTNNEYEVCKKWTQVRMLYNVGVYESAKKEYAALYPALNDRAEFMFEYGRCLNKLGEYEASNQALHETSLLTCDPMVFNVMGKNYQMMGQYEEAEQCFLRSINRLPGRIYPYYLLAKLCVEPGFSRPEQFEHAAQMVMTKEPKVQSTAIREMREEIKGLRKSLSSK